MLTDNRNLQLVDRLLGVRRAYGPVSDGGNRLFLASDASGRVQVHVVELSTGQPLRNNPPPLYVETQERTLPVAMTSQGLIVRHDRGGNETWQLSLVDHERRIRALTEDTRAKHESLHVSPDGARLGLTRNPGGQDDFRLSVLELKTGEIRDCLVEPGNWEWMAWSPDGESAVVTHRTAGMRNEAYILDTVAGVDSRQLRRLMPNARRVSDVTWAADGRIYALTDLDSQFMHAVEIDAKRPEEPVRQLLQPAHDVEAFVIDPTATKALAVVNEGPYDALVLYDLSARREEHRFELPPGTVFVDMSTSPADHVTWTEDGRTYLAWETPTQPAEIYELTSRARVATANAEELTGLVKPSATSYTSFDELEIPALQYRIDDTPRPTVVYFHGGPESQLRGNFQALFHLLLASGVNVFAPNVRGSSGYGLDYVSLDDRERRWDSVKDGCEAARHLKSTRLATTTGALGRSYGGFMTLAVLVEEPELWDAAVEYVGIADWHTFFRNTSGWRRAMRMDEYGDPEGAERDFLRDISPLRMADRIRTPLLVIHGRNDVRVPVSESEQIAAKTGAELLIFDDEGHGISKTANLRVAYERTVDFLVRHLQSEKRRTK